MGLDQQTKAVLERKMADAKQVIVECGQKFKPEETAIAWTGGKDSTMVLWLWRQVAAESGAALPGVFCIDEYDRFDQVHEFMAAQAEAWSIEVAMLINQDVVDAAGDELGGMVKVADLNQRNQAELKRLGFDEPQFKFQAESVVGNHLMKTVPLNQFIEDGRVQAMVQGLRWDEHPSRADDEYFAYHEEGELSPAHWRVNPILHLTERDIWDITLNYEVPHNPLYEQGYRSLGAKSTSQRLGDLPAWEQDSESTSERGGRAQDKEAAMAKLRALGYM